VATTYASNKRAIAVCDRCGFQYKLKELRRETIKGQLTNTKVCPECWEPDHPQLHLGTFPIYDPQAIRDPRTDSGTHASSRSLKTPFKRFEVWGRVPQVQVSNT
jgi:hypothetical protein